MSTRGFGFRVLTVVMVAVTALGSMLVTPVATAAQGSTYYVATNGNDSNPGSATQPWRTIQKATATLRAGDTVLVRGGTYSIANTDRALSPANSGTATAYITFKAHPGETVVIQGNYPTVGDSIWSGFQIEGRSYIRIEGFTIRGFHHGVGCKAPGHHITIVGNVLEYNSESGVSSSGSTNGGPGACDYLHIEGNTIRHNGYYMDGRVATGAYEGWGSGISINAHSNPYKFDSDYSRFHSVIRGNRIYHNYDGTGGFDGANAGHTDGNGIIIDMGGNIPPLLIENNVIFDNGGRCIHPYGSQNIWIVGNTCFRNNTDTQVRAPNSYAEIAGYAASLPLRNIHVYNNIAVARSDRQVTYFPDIDPAELKMENNLWYGGYFRDGLCPRGINYVVADPMFVNGTSDAGTADFRLRSGSPAIDKGRGSLGMGMQARDFDGVARPQGAANDMGAHEQTTALSGPTPTATLAPQPTPTATLTAPGPTPTATATPTRRKPKVSRSRPNTLAGSGGETVVIEGEGFQEGAIVTFGGVACLDVKVIDETQIECTAPPSSPRTVDVAVINPDGQSDVLPDGLLYDSPPDYETHLPLIGQ